MRELATERTEAPPVESGCPVGRHPMNVEQAFIYLWDWTAGVPRRWLDGKAGHQLKNKEVMKDVRIGDDADDVL